MGISLNCGKTLRIGILLFTYFQVLVARISSLIYLASFILDFPWPTLHYITTPVCFQGTVYPKFLIFSRFLTYPIHMGFVKFSTLNLISFNFCLSAGGTSAAIGRAQDLSVYRISRSIVSRGLSYLAVYRISRSIVLGSPGLVRPTPCPGRVRNICGAEILRRNTHN